MVIRCLGDDLARFVHDEFHGPPPSNAPVGAAPMARNPSNLVPVPAFPSVFDMRHVARRHLCTNRHKIKPRMRDWKYIYAGPSRGPRTNSRAPKDPAPPTLGTLPCEWSLLGEIYSEADLRMNEAHQLASAILAITFAAVMFVAGQLFIEYRASNHPLVQAVKTASLPL